MIHRGFKAGENITLTVTRASTLTACPERPKKVECAGFSSRTSSRESGGGFAHFVGN